MADKVDEFRQPVDGDNWELRTQRSQLTASDAVHDTYYGQPVIKPPHWRWLVITYFFFGALAGGGFMVGTVADFFGRDRSLTRAARYLSMAALIPSPPLLILDLGRPERFLNMLRIVKLRSPMSLGSWALSGLGMFSGIVAGLQLLSDLRGREVLPRTTRLAELLGIPFAIFVCGYTGVLLAITNVPIWARNTYLLGPTFVASAFSSTLAALSMILGVSGARKDTGMRLARAEVVAMSTELSLLLLGLLRLGRLGRPLTAPPLGLLFWPWTVGLGLVTPLLLQLTGPARGKERPLTVRILTSLLVLSGSYSLRMLMIFAGRRSTARPQDYFEMTDN
jgi:formate-dependent nitrite reductase membrane component NrfD